MLSTVLKIKYVCDKSSILIGNMDQKWLSNNKHQMWLGKINKCTYINLTKYDKKLVGRTKYDKATSIGEENVF